MKVLAERFGKKVAVDPLRRAAERRNVHGLETELRPLGNLVPNQRDLSMEVVGLAVKCPVADFGDEGVYCGVIDLFGLNAVGGGMSCQPRQADVFPPR